MIRAAAGWRWRWRWGVQGRRLEVRAGHPLAGAGDDLVLGGLRVTAVPGGMVFGVLVAAVVGAEFGWATERALRLICWRDGPDGRVLVETGSPFQLGRPDGSMIARALAAAGIYPSDLRRSPTLELAYAAVTSGLAPELPAEALR